MNRTEANTFADKVTQLSSLEQLQKLLSDASHIEVISRSDTPFGAKSATIPADSAAFRPLFDGAVMGIASATASRIAELKAQLGITEDAPAVADPAQQTDAPEAGTPVAVAEVALDEAPEPAATEAPIAATEPVPTAPGEATAAEPAAEAAAA